MLFFVLQCPVADMGTNINRFLGMYQTVGRNGSITVEVSVVTVFVVCLPVVRIQQVAELV